MSPETKPKRSPSGRKSGLRATTIRFTADLWTQLEAEAELAGVSVAQYVRDAALIRVTWEALRRDARAYRTAATALDQPPQPPSKPREAARELRKESRAVRAQAGQASRRARELANRLDEERQELERQRRRTDPG